MYIHVWYIYLPRFTRKNQLNDTKCIGKPVNMHWSYGFSEAIPSCNFGPTWQSEHAQHLLPLDKRLIVTFACCGHF